MELCQHGFLGENIWYVISSTTMLYDIQAEFTHHFFHKKKNKISLWDSVERSWLSAQDFTVGQDL